jgi:AraC-like DNA-binding protein
MNDTKQPKRPVYLDAVKKSIEETYFNAINENALARQAGVSLSKLQHDFPLFFGSNLQDYQTEIRISSAKNLLQNSNEQIKRIAREVGYKSGESFANAFKKIVGMTPSAYRKNLSRD